MLAGPEPLAALHMPGEHTQAELVHHHRGPAGRPVVPGILLLSVLVDGHHIAGVDPIWPHKTCV